jgi:S-adenosylmethionine:tRNA ribosyltransferase-isomerase
VTSETPRGQSPLGAPGGRANESAALADTEPLPIAAFDYSLPPELIAQAPAEPRDSARLLVIPRDGGPLRHDIFRHLGRYLAPGDLLVLNRTRVLPARLVGHRADTGRARVELLLLRPERAGVWEALGRPGRRLRPGTPLVFGAGLLRAEVVARTAHGTLQVRFVPPEILPLLDQVGQVPLPPYIRGWQGAPERYQTVYADTPGSAAAPTAGLHFTPELLAALQAQGIGVAYLVLHVGLDTFRPVVEEDARAHRMHQEYCSVPDEVVGAIAAARARAGRVIAVGTTVVRALETAALAAERHGTALASYTGWTDLYITPGYRFRAIDGLITNFHLPRSTLLLLVSALIGRERLLAAYAEAIAHRYRFYSFGDATLIL